MTITSKLNYRYFLIAAAKYWTKLMEFIWNLWSSQYVLPCSVVSAQRPGEWYKVCPFLRWSFLGSRANISGMQCWPIRAYICLIYLERLNHFLKNALIRMLCWLSGRGCSIVGVCGESDKGCRWQWRGGWIWIYKK